MKTRGVDVRDAVCAAGGQTSRLLVATLRPFYAVVGCASHMMLNMGYLIEDVQQVPNYMVLVASIFTSSDSAQALAINISCLLHPITQEVLASLNTSPASALSAMHATMLKW
jgi:hypothetical protein